MNKKNALILGVTGQGGSFMAKILLEKNFNVFGLVRKSATGNLDNIEEIKYNKKFKILHGDLLDLNSISNAIKSSKASQVYNFADQDHVRWSYEIPSYSFSVTALSVIEILELIKNNFPKIKYFQYLSSICLVVQKINHKTKANILQEAFVGKSNAFMRVNYIKTHII